jgi:hypothetical protein
MTTNVELRCRRTAPAQHIQAVEAIAASLAGEPVLHMDEGRLATAAAALPSAVEHMRRELAPSSNEEVREALELLAERLDLRLPRAIALDLDLQLMSHWPRRLFRQAFAQIWQVWTYRRFPGVGDFRTCIEADLAELGGRVAQLKELELKLGTAAQRERWDWEARERHATEKAQERARWTTHGGGDRRDMTGGREHNAPAKADTFQLMPIRPGVGPSEQ